MKIQTTPKSPVSYLNAYQKNNAVQKQPKPIKGENVENPQSTKPEGGVERPRGVLPEDFQPLLRLTKQEQKFFEELFPKSRREIRAYVEQQQKIFQEKGQLIDRKG